MLITKFFGVVALLSWALFFFALYAFVDAAFRRPDAYRAAGKNNKAFWLIILGIAAVVMKLFPVMSFLPIIGLIAVIVYVVDVRPAVRQVTGRASGPRLPFRLRGRSRIRSRTRTRIRNRNRNRGSSSDGPYGPYNG